MRKMLKTGGFILAGLAAFVFIITATLFIIGGGFMKATYLEPWSKDYCKQYTDMRVRLAAVGLLAPSNHNMQPWLIKLDKNNPEVFYLYADSSRLTAQVDPLSRQMMVTQGAFLEYIAVAGEKEGYKTDIAIFPDGEYDEENLAKSMDSKPVAKITLKKAEVCDESLYDGLFMPNTNRNAYKKDKLTDKQISALEALSDDSDVGVKIYCDNENVGKIGELAMNSAKIEAGVDRVMKESDKIFRPNEREKNKFRSGYSVEGQGASGFKKNVLQGLVTLFPSFNQGKSASDNFINYTQTSVDNTPAYALVTTRGNSRSEQVKSGMVYTKAVLIGHTLWLSMQPLSQVLEEYPEMKEPYDKFKALYAPDSGTVQMLLRVGVADSDTPQSMRRDVSDLILID